MAAKAELIDPNGILPNVLLSTEADEHEGHRVEFFEMSRLNLIEHDLYYWCLDCDREFCDVSIRLAGGGF